MSARAAAASTKVRLGPGAAALLPPRSNPRRPFGAVSAAAPSRSRLPRRRACVPVPAASLARPGRAGSAGAARPEGGWARWAGPGPPSRLP